MPFISNMENFNYTIYTTKPMQNLKHGRNRNKKICLRSILFLLFLSLISGHGKTDAEE